MGPSITSVLKHLSDRLAEQGYTLLTHTRSANPPPIREMWKTLTPAAVLMIGDGPELAAELRRSGVTIVLQFNDSDSGTNPFDADATGRIQVEHLHQRGHRRIGFAAPSDPRLGSLARDRLRGVQRACKTLGLAQPLELAVPLEIDDAAAAVRAWGAAETPVTAVCAYNDEIAISVLAGAWRAGIAVPEDLAVIGIDDIPAARIAVPPLSTVRFSAAESADRWTQQVLGAISREHVAVSITATSGQLVVREST